jgi:hypothetical protein
MSSSLSDHLFFHMIYIGLYPMTFVETCKTNGYIISAEEFSSPLLQM